MGVVSIKMIGAIYFRAEMKLSIRNRVLGRFALFYGILFAFYLFLPPGIYSVHTGKAAGSVFDHQLMFCLRAFNLMMKQPQLPFAY